MHTAALDTVQRVGLSLALDDFVVAAFLNRLKCIFSLSTNDSHPLESLDKFAEIRFHFCNESFSNT